ncbi:F7 protein [Hirschfeldia incana]|nr:F7 protein [Hirschfeldia incana]
MTDNIFEGLPTPSSQHQELPNSSNPDKSKDDETPSPAPTLVLKSSLKRSKPAESAPDASAPPVLKSALKRSKPAESTPEPEPEVPKKRLQFKTSTDASEEQVVDAMQKITSHIKNPSKFSKASKLAIRLIQAGSVKPETSGYFVAMLEAAMSSKTPCTDRLVRADYHALFSAAQDVAEWLDKSQKNLLTIWTIKAVVANDLFTDDSFMFSKTATQIKEAISDLPVATEEDDAEEAAALAQEAVKESGDGETTQDVAEAAASAGGQEDVESDPFGLDAWIPSGVKKNGKTKMTKEDTDALEKKKFLRSKREALITCLEIAARRYKVPWCQTVIDILVKHAFENVTRFTSQQRQAVEKLWASVREQHLRRKQGKSVTGKLDVTAFESLQDKYANEKMSIRKSVGANGERRAQQWLG